MLKSGGGGYGGRAGGGSFERGHGGELRLSHDSMFFC